MSESMKYDSVSVALKLMEQSIRKSLSECELWGDLNYSKDDYDGIHNLVKTYTEEQELYGDSMHRAKGLEFDCVVLIGMDESNMPNRKAVESAENRMEEKDLILQERLLLYVAVTRAKKEIAITCTGNMTPFLQ